MVGSGPVDLRPCTEPWLEWIRFELARGGLAEAASLHQRAVAAVADPAAFMAAYNALA